MALTEEVYRSLSNRIEQLELKLGYDDDKPKDHVSVYSIFLFIIILVSFFINN